MVVREAVLMSDHYFYPTLLHEVTARPANAYFSSLLFYAIFRTLSLYQDLGPHCGDVFSQTGGGQCENPTLLSQK